MTPGTDPERAEVAEPGRSVGGDDRRRAERPALLIDAMCGRLATYLRMCGYDAAYVLDRDAETDADALDLAGTEGRTLVTRDRELARAADDAILLTERDIEDQLAEVAAAGLDLELSPEPARCGACNGPVERARPETPTPEYAPDPRTERVWRCRECGQHFWKGSHWEDVAERLSGI